jgi:hypothetical protein
MKTISQKSEVESLAELLNGREYRDEISGGEADKAKENGLVVVFGASDDLIEFRGAIHDEVGLYDGGEITVDAQGISPEWNDDDPGSKEECRKYFEREKLPKKAIRCDWDKDGYSWLISVKRLDHATFDILEDGEKYCRGIVFRLSDISEAR